MQNPFFDHFEPPEGNERVPHKILDKVKFLGSIGSLNGSSIAIFNHFKNSIPKIPFISLRGNVPFCNDSGSNVCC